MDFVLSWLVGTNKQSSNDLYLQKEYLIKNILICYVIFRAPVRVFKNKESNEKTNEEEFDTNENKQENENRETNVVEESKQLERWVMVMFNLNQIKTYHYMP